MKDNWPTNTSARLCNPPFLIVSLSLDGKVTSISASASDGDPLTRSITVGSDFVDLWPDESRECVETALQQALDAVISKFVVQVGITEDGADIRQVILFPVISKKGDVIGVTAIAGDMVVCGRWQERSRLNESRLEALLKLSQMTHESVDQLITFAMEEGVRLTGSDIGYVAFVDKEESVMTMQSWSRSLDNVCPISERPKSIPVESSGLLGEAIRQRRPIVTNEYSVNGKYCKGHPEGHPVMTRHMNVPIFEDGRIVAVAGVANKAEHYDESDIYQLALLMDGMWKIIQRKRSEEALRMQSSAVNAAGDQILIADADGNIEFANPAFERETGYRLNELIGQNTSLLREGLDDDYLHRSIRSSVLAGCIWHGELTNRRKDGSMCVDDVTITPIKGEDGKIEHFVEIRRNVTEKKMYEQKLDHMAHHDALTDLPNRLLFAEKLTQSIHSVDMYDTHLAVMFIDLDRFKPINDNLGHNVGDLLLKEVAKRLRSTLRGADTIARMGGDEFTVILTGIPNSDTCEIIAQKILKTLEEPFHINGHELFISASIGTSMFPEHGINAETLVKNADTAMYRAKDNGRSTHVIYSESMSNGALQQITLESGLRKALDRGELTLHYQPFVRMSSGVMCGAEALIRWNHPERGPIPPTQFIPVAENTGLIVPISEWVLREACRQNKRWQDEGLPRLNMAVNISARLFCQDELIVMVKRALNDSGLAPQHLDLEITESTLMQNPDRAAECLRQLKDMGVKISIDDFGTGYSSLNYLKRFPIDTVKIDKSFVNDITTNPDDAAIAGAVVAMAHSLNLKVVAEGVETVEQLSFLRALKCDEMQGYFISRPVNADDFLQLFDQSDVSESDLLAAV